MQRERCWRCVHCVPAVVKIDYVPYCRKCARELIAKPGDLRIMPLSTDWQRISVAV